MTESRQYIRVLLYGCAHKPKFSAMSHPKKGEWITCYACRTAREVVGTETGWKMAQSRCCLCKWRCASENMTKRKMVFLSQKHADATGHNVLISKDGYETKIAPRVTYQPPLVDDLLFPD
jgi:hypothetical protein